MAIHCPGDIGNLHRLVGGNASAGDAAGGERIEPVRHFHRVVRHHDALFRHAAVNAVAGVFHRTAQGFVAADAVFAMAATLVKPGDAGAVTHFNEVTPSPTAETTPMPSCPNVMPGTSPKSPFFTCKSVWHTRNTPFSTPPRRASAGAALYPECLRYGFSSLRQLSWCFP